MSIVIHDPQTALRLTDPQTTISRRNWRPLYWLGAALLLLCLQLLNGTAPLFAGLVFTFAVFTYLTIKTLGGIDTLTGLLIAYLAAQHVLISQVAKVCFWQPADVNLTHPIETIGVYAVAMGALWLAAVASNCTGVGRRRILFTSELDTRHFYWLALVTTVLAIARAAAVFGVGGGGQQGVSGGIIGPIQTLVFLPDLAIVCGTAYIIRSSQGRRSIGLLNGTIIIALSFIGVLGTTRVAILGPLTTYLLTCVAFRFRFRMSHFITLGILLLIAQRLLFPLALIGRSIAHNSKASLSTNWGASFNLLVEAIEDPSLITNAQKREEKAAAHLFRYYDQQMQELDRYSMILWTDAIVGAELTQGPLGMKTITPGFQALVPRFIQPDKPFTNSGNLLAHRVPGWIPKADVTTGISVGFFADSFSCFGWAGVAVIPFLIGVGIFTVYRFMITDKLWGNVWALALALHLCWAFSEGTIDAQIISIFEAPFIISVIFWFLPKLARACERLLPVGRLLQHFDSLLRRRARYNI